MKQTHIKLALLTFLLVSGQTWAADGGHFSGGHGGGHFSGGHGGGYFSGGHGGGHRSVDTHVGVYFGPSFGYDTHYSPFYYPYYRVVIAPSPTVYIERGNPQSVVQPYHWYFCANPEGYYPYVQQCPGGWQQVAPHPPS